MGAGKAYAFTKPPCDLHALSMVRAAGRLPPSAAKAGPLSPAASMPDHGAWSHKEGHGYRAVSEAYIVFDSPAGSPLPLHRSVQRITQDIAFDEDQPDTFTSEARLQYLGLSPARPVLATGCA